MDSSDYNAFSAALTRLAGVYGRTMTPETQAAYWQSLQYKPLDVVLRAMDRIRDEESRFPVPATVHQYCATVMAENRSAENRPYDVGPREREVYRQGLHALTRIDLRDKEALRQLQEDTISAARVARRQDQGNHGQR